MFNYPGYREKTTKKASERLGKYIKKVRLEGQGDRSLVFHSFRGTFTTLCAGKKMNDSARRYIGGWTQAGDDKAYLAYNNLPLTEIKEIIDIIDLSFLAGSKKIEKQEIKQIKDFTARDAK
jgi:hypothetical protein